MNEELHIDPVIGAEFMAQVLPLLEQSRESTGLDDHTFTCMVNIAQAAFAQGYLLGQISITHPDYAA